MVDDFVKIILFFVGLFCIVYLVAAAKGAPIDSTYGGGGGGYTQLPQCTTQRLGQTLYVQGYLWRCINDSYGYRWVVVR